MFAYLPSSKQARLSAKAIQKSLNCSGDEARLLLAELLGANSWKHLCQAMTTSISIPGPHALEELKECWTQLSMKALSYPHKQSMRDFIDAVHPFQEKPMASSMLSIQ